MNGEEMKQWSEGGREGGLVERKKEKFKEGSLLHSLLCTEWMEWMLHRKQKETKQQPGTAGPDNILGCCLVSLRFLCDIHSVRSYTSDIPRRLGFSP